MLREFIEPLERRRLLSATMTLQNLDVLPANDRLIFNRIQHPNPKLGDFVHDTDTLRIRNTGTSTLNITSYSLSSQWTLVSPPKFPFSISPGSSRDLKIKFIATSEPAHSHNETNDHFNPNGGGVYTGSLVLHSNASNTPTKTVTLAGYWQDNSEHSEEPNLQTLVNLLAGFKTNINSTFITNLTEPANSPQYYGEESVHAFWQRADSSQPITVRQLDSFHTQGNTATLFWYDKTTHASHSVMTTASDAGQMLFPYLNGTKSPAAATFTPSSKTFGFRVDGEWSLDSLNHFRDGGGHHVRFFPLRDASGKIVANTYLMAIDYGNLPNFDFQDNVYVISNIKPA